MSALSDRLVKQLLRIHDRRLELETKQQELDNKVREEAELRKNLEADVAKVAKVKAVRETLEKMNEESEAKYKAVQAEDAEQRKQISNELKEKIAEAEELSQDLAQREQRATARKELLRKQEEIYDTHSNAGKEKFDALAAKRESEAAALEQKKEDSIRRAPEVKAQLEAETAQLATAKEEQAALQAKVSEYFARFAEIQKMLEEAKAAYEAASKDKDRNTRAIKALESDMEMLRRRAANSVAERDKEQAKVAALEEKAKATREQIAKFDALEKVLAAPADGSADS